MPSLHRHSSGRSPFWFAKFRDFNGSVIVKSTKQKNKTQALEIALAWERAAGGSTTEAQARKVLDEMLERAGQNKIKTISVKEFFTDWLKGKELSKKPRTTESYRKVVELFLESLGVHVGNPIANLTSKDVQNFLNVRLKEGLSSATVNFDVKLIRAVLSSARKQGFRLDNPAEAVELVKATQNTRDTFAPEQIAKLVSTAKGEWKTAILLGYYLGARLGDVVSMTWDCVDLDKNLITYTQNKTGKRVVVPIHNDLEAHLFEIADDQPHGVLCPTLSKRAIGGRSGLSFTFAKIMRDAKIDQQQVKSKGTHGRTFSQLSFHSLRHSFASVLANAGISDEVRMKLTGHSSSEIHQKYTHFQLAPLRAAIEVIPSIKKSKKRK